MKIYRLPLTASVCLLAMLAIAGDLHANDFPTQARAEYVFACMNVNGSTMDLLYRCSCSLDSIASNMTFAEYTEAETIASLRLMQGDRASVYRDSEFANQKLEKFQEAQAEADLECF